MPTNSSAFFFESRRLGFRRWTPSDKEAFIRIYGDAEAMRFFPKVLSRDEALARVNLFDENIALHGYGLWAAVLKETDECIGVIGLKETTFEAFFTPCAGLTWILDKNFWHRGLATEGASRCIAWGFAEKNFTEVYAYTTLQNYPSQEVMKRLGMENIGSFMHPQVTPGPLKRHVLYKLKRDDFLKRNAP